MVTLLGLELLLFRYWVDVVSVDNPRGLAALLAERGPGTVRFVLVRFAAAFALVSLVFVDIRAFEAPKRVLSEVLRRPLSLRLLFVHVVSALLFAALTVSLISRQVDGAADVILIAGWLSLGAIALTSGVMAFVPAPFWQQVFRSMRQVIAFAGLVSAGAYGFSEVSLRVWPYLSRATMTVAAFLLHPLVPDLVLDWSNLIMGRPGFLVMIGPACSGSDGLALMLVFMAAWLGFHRAEWRFPQAFMLVPVALLLVWILNCVRISALVLIGIWGAPEVAIDGFHTQAGWVAFCAVALGICVLARRVTWFLEAPSRESDTEVSYPAAAYLMPLLAILAASMLARLASDGFEWLYPLRVIAGAGALWYFRRHYALLEWRAGWLAVGWGVLVYALWIGYDYVTAPADASGMPSALNGASAGLAVTWKSIRALGAIVTVPLAEELAFRGFLMRQFSGAEFESVRWREVSWTAILLSSLAFGLLHGELWIPGTLAGVAYALALRQSGSFGDAVVAHAITNALIAVTVLLTGAWHLW
jgi:exosortase E/protease (VPEID-CTERM system)